MHNQMNRLTGIVILIGAILGLVLSIYGLYAVWTIKPTVTGGLQDMFELAERGLNATDGMLVVMHTSLDQAAKDLELMRGVLGSTSESIGRSTSTLDETATVLGDTMPQFLENTQTSLKSTQQTARLIDDILTTLSNIPLIGSSLGARYRPDVPLSESVAQVSKSLDPLNSSFSRLNSDMRSAASTLATIQRQIDALGRQMKEIETSVDNATKEVESYQIILADVKDRLERVKQRLPLLVDISFLALTVTLLWLGVSQLGALLHAIELLSRREPAG